MTDTGSPKARRPRSRVIATLKALIRTRIMAGLITILPIIITFWLVRLVFRWLRDASLWLISLLLLSSWSRGFFEHWGILREHFTAGGLTELPPRLQWGISIFAVLLTVLLLYAIGLFAAHVIGRRILELVDQVAARLPFVKTIYGGLKLILGLFSNDPAHGFQRVVLVPFPTETTRSIAFVTSTLKDTQTGEDLCTVFVPKTPNPTGGFVFVVRRTDLVEVSWTVEEAIKMIVSGGFLSPAVLAKGARELTSSSAGTPPPGLPVQRP